MPNRQLADYRDILARLESADVLIEQTLALLKRGLKAGITPATITLRDVPSHVANQTLTSRWTAHYCSLLRTFRIVLPLINRRNSQRVPQPPTASV